MSQHCVGIQKRNTYRLLGSADRWFFEPSVLQQVKKWILFSVWWLDVGTWAQKASFHQIIVFIWCYFFSFFLFFRVDLDKSNSSALSMYIQTCCVRLKHSPNVIFMDFCLSLYLIFFLLLSYLFWHIFQKLGITLKIRLEVNFSEGYKQHFEPWTVWVFPPQCTWDLQPASTTHRIRVHGCCCCRCDKSV